MDLYTAGTGTTGNHLFKNNGDTTKKWIEINLEGGNVNGNNRMGVGAQIEIRAGALSNDEGSEYRRRLSFPEYDGSPFGA